MPMNGLDFPRVAGGRRPLLLASLIGPREAAAAIDGRADVLDLKDPRRGAMGACDPEAVRAVARLRDDPGTLRTWGRRVPISAALGDVQDAPISGRYSVPGLAAACAAAGAEVLKLGLAGVPNPEDAASILRVVARAARAGARGVRIVAASYADAAAAGAPDPALLPAIAAAAGVDGCLLDTFRKDGRTLAELMPQEDLRQFVAACRAAGLLCALAGSLGEAQLPAVVALRPDVIGARGALCEGGRSGRLDAARVRAFRDALMAAAGVAAGGPGTAPVAPAGRDRRRGVAGARIDSTIEPAF